MELDKQKAGIIPMLNAGDRKQSTTFQELKSYKSQEHLTVKEVTDHFLHSETYRWGQKGS